MSIAANANLGFGIGSPSERIHVNGNVRVSGGFRAGDGVLVGPSYSFNGALNSGMWHSSGGDLNFSRAGVLVQSNTANQTLMRSGATSTPGMSFIGDPNTGWFNPTADVLAGSTGGFERLRIVSTGNAGFNTTAPSTTLHVNGPIRHAVYTVATLPAAGTVGSGTRAAVTDANATTFASIVAAGGANGVPVYSDGTNWRIG
jgi:hypothetical protein